MNDYYKSLSERERHFSEYATRSDKCSGRKNCLKKDSNRTEFERDYHRVLHSLPFRRLKHKTQVFYAPQNDHICTRMEHALHVASISSTICIHLDLNVDLAEAIALAHDLGHPPFGHVGEESMNRINGKYKLGAFSHEAQSLRVIDNFKDKAHDYTLNLTYEVRDGVVCHCGELNEQSVEPNRQKDITLVDCTAARNQNPGTLEGCVVRIADRISYLGRDLEDAIEAEIITQEDIPHELTDYLGESNSEMIGKLIGDVIKESKWLDKITFSDNTAEIINKLKDFNTSAIYKNIKITKQKNRINNIIEDLYETFYQAITETNRGKQKKNGYDGDYYNIFFDFLKDMDYSDTEADAQIVSDFIAGMTDNFAIRAYQYLFLLSPPV